MAETSTKVTKTTASKTAVSKPAAKKPASKAAVASAKPEVKKAASPAKPAAKPAVKPAAKKPAVKKPVVALEKAPVKAMVVSDAQRYRMVAEAAYYRAESNQFKSDPVRDWIEAESDIAALLNGRK